MKICNVLGNREKTY